MIAPLRHSESLPAREPDGAAGGRRFSLMVTAFGLSFIAVCAQLVSLGANPMPTLRMAVAEDPIRHALSRPDIVDRHGRMLATDIRAYWLYADPQQILDADEAAERLAPILGDLDRTQLRRRLQGAGRFAWIKRGLTPNDASAVHRLGLPGLHLIAEPQRVYPAGSVAAHVLGHTDVDNRGLAGIEKLIDRSPDLIAVPADTDQRPRVALSLDLRVQHVLHDELRAARARYRAEAAAGLVLDVRSGAVLALASLPDYDPNHRDEALAKGRQNRLHADAYELGSVFKAFAVAALLDDALARPMDLFDVGTPLLVGGFRLTDKYARRQFASVEEIFTRSSNTGAARIALYAGRDRQQALLRRLGLFDPLATELGVAARPLTPAVWRDITTVTVSYGHGLSVAPLAFASAVATLINGGTRITPSFLRDGAAGQRQREQALRPGTSAMMRRLFWMAVEDGTGRRAKVPGYRVGGKTGTAYKPKGGGYSKDVITSFVAAFPMDDPQYLVYVLLDGPHAAAAGEKTDAAWNATPTAGAVIGRIAPMLGIAPSPAFDETVTAAY